MPVERSLRLLEGLRWTNSIGKLTKDIEAIDYSMRIDSLT
jgi:hypothetical protein